MARSVFMIDKLPGKWGPAVAGTVEEGESYEENIIKEAEARDIEADLREDFSTLYDQGGAIGRRYRRQDEAGTPFCLTIDYQSKEDGTVTLRYRDSMEQVRVHREDLTGAINKAVKEYKRES